MEICTVLSICHARNFLLALATTLLGSPCVAGQLDDFESGLKKPTATQPQHGRTAQTPGKDFLDELIEEIFINPFTESVGDFFHVIFTPAAQASMVLQDHHTPGDATLPVLRVDLFTQHLSTDLYALDVRSQLGYGQFMIMAQVSDYQERHPLDALTALRWGLGGRFAFGDYLQAQVIIGAMQFSGNNVTTRALITTPFAFTYGRYAVEYRPTFADGVREHDLAARYQHRYWSVELGYRTLSSTRATLEGPYIGIGMHW